MKPICFTVTLRRVLFALIPLATFSLFAALLSTSCSTLAEEETPAQKIFPALRWGPTMLIDPDNGEPYYTSSIAIDGGYVYATTRNAVYRTTYPDSSEWQKVADLYYPIVDTAAGGVIAYTQSEVYLMDERLGQMVSWGQDCPSTICKHIRQIVYVDSTWFVAGLGTKAMLRNEASEWKHLIPVSGQKIQGVSDGLFFYSLYGTEIYWLPSPDFTPLRIECDSNRTRGILEVGDSILVFHERGVALLEEKARCRDLLLTDRPYFADFYYHPKNLDGVVMPTPWLEFYDIENNLWIEYEPQDGMHGGWLTHDGYLLLPGNGGLYRVSREEIK